MQLSQRGASPRLSTRYGGGMTVRIANAARRCWAVVGDRECDPRNEWLRALLRPVRSWSRPPARLEELA